MSVRVAKFVDIRRITEIVTQTHARSVYADYEITDSVRDNFKKLCVACLQGHPKSSCLFVAERDGVIVGFIAGITDKVYHVLKQRYATDLFFCVDHEKRGGRYANSLLTAFVRWAESREDVVEIRVGAVDVASDSGRLRPLYERKGFTAHGAIYRKECGR